MNAAKLENSGRLQAVKSVLNDGKWHTTLDLMKHTHGCAIHSDIAELRANGVGVECQYYGTNDQGWRVYRYRLEGAAS